MYTTLVFSFPFIRFTIRMSYKRFSDEKIKKKEKNKKYWLKLPDYLVRSSSLEPNFHCPFNSNIKYLYWKMFRHLSDGFGSIFLFVFLYIRSVLNWMANFKIHIMETYRSVVGGSRNDMKLYECNAQCSIEMSIANILYFIQTYKHTRPHNYYRIAFA